MMRRMFASSFGCFSSLLGLDRLNKSLTQTMPARNSLSPSSTVERPQPNTSSAVRALPSNNTSVTSAIACRRSGHATRFTSRPANSTAHSGICFSSNRDFFMCLALFLVAHENTYKWYVSNYFITEQLYQEHCRSPLNLMANNRAAFYCPAAPRDSAWDTNANKTLGGMGEDNVYSPFTITPASRFSFGYNDWGLYLRHKPHLGLGGDVDGAMSMGLVKESDVARPTEMIMLADVRAQEDTALLDCDRSEERRVGKECRSR